MAMKKDIFLDVIPVALVKTGVSVERIASTFRLNRISELRVTLATYLVAINVVPSWFIHFTLMMEAI
jgi:hypothetical protein